MKKFTQPQKKYFTSFISAVNQSINNQEYNGLNYSINNFENLSKEVSNRWEKEEYYWLVYNNEFLGDLIIRKILSPEELLVGGHISYFVSPEKRNNGYGEEILIYALNRIKELDIDKIVITCYEDNIYSKKIIEKLGGKIIHRFHIKKFNKVLLRYVLNNISK